MIRRSFRFGLLLGLLSGVAFALAKVLRARPGHETASVRLPSEPWPRLSTEPVAPAPAADLPFVPDPAAPSPVAPVVEEAVVEPAPAPAKPQSKKDPTKKDAAAKKAAGKKKAPVKAWVEPTGGVCPTSHPVKAKMASKIFHLPGMLNYERTNPDRCYLDEIKATADGLRAAKR